MNNPQSAYALELEQHIAKLEATLLAIHRASPLSRAEIDVIADQHGVSGALQSGDDIVGSSTE